MSERSRDLQVARQTVRPRHACPHCNPGAVKRPEPVEEPVNRYTADPPTKVEIVLTTKDGQQITMVLANPREAALEVDSTREEIQPRDSDWDPNLHYMRQYRQGEPRVVLTVRGGTQVQPNPLADVDV